MFDAQTVGRREFKKGNNKNSDNFGLKWKKGKKIANSKVFLQNLKMANSIRRSKFQINILENNTVI